MNPTRSETSPFRQRVDLLRESIAASARQDFAKALEAMAEDLELHLPPEFPGAATSRGHDGWLRARAELEEAFADIDYQPQEFVEAGDRVLATIRYLGHARHTEIAVDVLVYWLYTFRGTKVSRMDVFFDKPKALVAAGLPESTA